MKKSIGITLICISLILIIVINLFLVYRKDNTDLTNDTPEKQETSLTLVGTNIRIAKTKLKFESEPIDKHIYSIDELIGEGFSVDKESKINTSDIGTLYIATYLSNTSLGCRKFISRVSISTKNTIEVNCYGSIIVPTTDTYNKTLIYELTYGDEKLNNYRKDVDLKETRLGIYDFSEGTYRFATLENVPSSNSNFQISNDGQNIAFFSGYNEDGKLNLINLLDYSWSQFATGTTFDGTPAIGAVYDNSFQIFSPYSNTIAVPKKLNLLSAEKSFDLTIITFAGRVIHHAENLRCSDNIDETIDNFGNCLKWVKTQYEENLIYSDPLMPQGNVEIFPISKTPPSYPR